MGPSLTQISRDIGGAHLASLRAFSVFIPIWLLGSLLGLPHLDSARGVVYALGGNAVGFALAWLVLLGLRRTLFRERARSHVPLWIVLVGGALLGATKGLSTMMLLELVWSDGAHASLLVERGLSAAIVGMWFLPSAAFLEATLERFQAARAIASAEELARLHPRPPIAEETTSRIDELLTQALEIANDTVQSPDTRAQSLTALSHEHLKPLIEHLWSESREDHRTHWPLTVQAIAAARPISPLVVSVGVLAVSSGLIVSTVGIVEGLGRLGIMALLASLFSIVARAPISSKPMGGLSLMGATSVAYTTTNETLAGAVFGPFGGFSSLATGALNAAIFFTMLVVSALINLSGQEAERLRVQLDGLFGIGNWSSDDLRDINRLRQRELATLLHGQFQNGLISAELALRGGANPSQLHQFVQLIEQLRAQLLNNQPAQQGHHDSLGERLSTLAERWRGMVDITTEGVDEVSVSPELSDYLFQVCEEAVSNSSRHGLAQRVSIGITDDGSQICLVLTDNGVGPRAGKPGLGTFLLNSRSKTTWTLSSRQNQPGSTLTLTTART